MNIRFGRQQSNQGSALVVTFCVCGVLFILMGSYLYMVQGQRESVARSQTWNKALVVAEAGVEESMALLNTTGFNLATYGTYGNWVANSTTLKVKVSPLATKQFEDSYYSVTIYRTNLPNPVIIATGFVPVPMSTQLVSRVVQVVAKPRPTFLVNAPMIVFDTFDANGSKVATDSFTNSGGVITKTSNGDVVTLSTNTGSILIGNATINGSVRTPKGGTATSPFTNPAGSETVQIGGGLVGDGAWIANTLRPIDVIHPNFE